jgi:hypothetical protein
MGQHPQPRRASVCLGLVQTKSYHFEIGSLMHNPEFLHFRCPGHITQHRSSDLGGVGILGGWWTKITLGISLTSWAYLHLTAVDQR